MDVDYWSTRLSQSDFQALCEWAHELMREKYNLHQRWNNSKKQCKRYKTSLIDYNLLKVTNMELDKNRDIEIDNRKPLSQQALNARINKSVELVLTHDASVVLAQNFLGKFTKKLMKKSYNNDFVFS